jgi:DNA-binding NtrC family response regulator
LLLVEDDPRLAEQFRWALRPSYGLECVGDRHAALDALERVRPDLVLLDLCLPPENVPEEGFRVLEAARATGATVVVMSGLDERQAALRAIDRGAYDFFQKPFDLDALRIVLARAVERRSIEAENRRLREQLRERFHLDGMVGVSAPIRAVTTAVQRVADTGVTVILEGESGTGKEVIARAIHYHSARRAGPFVALHCAALPESLLESELFGHEKGAFTGATATRIGRFEAASGGTLFLDEVGCLAPQTQTKLLRVLEERTVERIGSNRPHPVDIRLVAATNEDLGAKVRRNEFREDLYFRIHVFPIRLPPLRERPEDVPLLAEHFLKLAAEARGAGPKRLAPDAAEALRSRSWPGNVRELRNLVDTLSVLADGEMIGRDEVERVAAEAAPAHGREAHGFKAAIEAYERKVLVEAIQRAQGVKAQAARALGLDASQMKYLTRKHGL